MKNRSLVLLASIFLGIIFILSVADAQPVFNFDTAGPGAYLNGTGSGASGSIDFTDLQGLPPKSSLDSLSLSAI